MPLSGTISMQPGTSMSSCSGDGRLRSESVTRELGRNERYFLGFLNRCQERCSTMTLEGRISTRIPQLTTGSRLLIRGLVPNHHHCRAG